MHFRKFVPIWLLWAGCQSLNVTTHFLSLIFYTCIFRRPLFPSHFNSIYQQQQQQQQVGRNSPEPRCSILSSGRSGGGTRVGEMLRGDEESGVNGVGLYE
jgi:hypothetical protein